ncbi:hypothetical protein Daesc_006559 [Daldinia eschscholtzii]|uniref:Uncharacterized protein n=1 Tax=Daldinia eschscholtzii TaxID=292717 RepID=A0AAX6MIN4_9PEZI
MSALQSYARANKWMQPHEFCYSCGRTWKTCNCGLGEENVVYEVEMGDGGPMLLIDQIQIIQLAGQQAERNRRRARLEQAERRPTDVLFGIHEQMQLTQQENQRPEQRHDHGPSTSAPRLQGTIGTTDGQAQYLLHRQNPEPPIENPLRLFRPLRATIFSLEPALSPLPPQNTIRQRRNYQLPNPLDDSFRALEAERAREDFLNNINIRHPSWYGPNPPIDVLHTDLSRVRQPREEVIHRAVIPPARRIPSTGSTSNPLQIHDPLAASQTTQAVPRRQPELAPQNEEASRASNPSTPPSQLLPSTPNTPPTQSP